MPIAQRIILVAATLVLADAPRRIFAAPPTTAAAAPSAQSMRQSVGEWTFMEKDRLRRGAFLEFVPGQWDGISPLPMIIFLHGAGYRGEDIARLEAAELVKQVRAGRMFPAIVLCPQVTTYWTGEQAATFIDQALGAYAGRFDPDRVYLTGESAGGGGAWEAAKLRADHLAAVVPIATTLGTPDGASTLVGLPIWAFHNVHDPYQPVEKSRAQVRAVRDAGGLLIWLTEYTQTPGKRKDDGTWPNAHRHAWETAYRDPGLWEWLFRQRRGQPDLAHDGGPTTRTSPQD